MLESHLDGQAAGHSQVAYRGEEPYREPPSLEEALELVSKALRFLGGVHWKLTHSRRCTGVRAIVRSLSIDARS